MAKQPTLYNEQDTVAQWVRMQGSPTIVLTCIRL